MTKLLSSVTIHKGKQSFERLGHVLIIFSRSSCLLTVTMSDDEYDKLSKEEREAKDKADREHEAGEQAGRMSFNGTAIVCLMANTLVT